MTVVMTGFEHETAAEKFMPVRQIGYDGQSYRAQLLPKKVKRVYPVITMVLYFGTTHWPYSHHLSELIDTPDIYKPFVCDYEMKNLFEVAFLEPEQVKWFKSDFRYVADYFVQKRLTNNYKPGPDTIDHVDATLKLMSVLTGDCRFEDSLTKIQKTHGGVSMEKILDRMIDSAVNSAIDGNKKETAERMIRDGALPDAKIAEYSGLTVKQVQKIKTEMLVTA